MYIADQAAYVGEVPTTLAMAENERAPAWGLQQVVIEHFEGTFHITSGIGELKARQGFFLVSIGSPRPGTAR